MERRQAITVAAAASLTMLAGAAGIALNSGIVGANDDDDVGQLSPVSASSPPITVYLPDPATLPANPAPVVRVTEDQPVTSSSASGYEHDEEDHDEDEVHDDRSQHGDDDRSDDDDHEYEGADDDD